MSDSATLLLSQPPAVVLLRAAMGCYAFPGSLQSGRGKKTRLPPFPPLASRTAPGGTGSVNLASARVFGSLAPPPARRSPEAAPEDASLQSLPLASDPFRRPTRGPHPAWRSRPHGVLLHRQEEGNEIERLREPRSLVQARSRRLGVRRDDDDGNIGEQGILPLRLPELPSVHRRHHEVEHDEVGPLGASLSQALHAIPCRRDGVPLVREDLRYRLAYGRVVLDDENALRGLARHVSRVIGRGRPAKKMLAPPGGAVRSVPCSDRHRAPPHTASTAKRSADGASTLSMQRLPRRRSSCRPSRRASLTNSGSESLACHLLAVEVSEGTNVDPRLELRGCTRSREPVDPGKSVQWRRCLCHT